MTFNAILVSLVAHGASLPEGFSPVVSPTDAPKQYEQWASDKGRPGSLACARVWTADSLLCFRTQDGKVRRWVLHEDLRSQNLTLDGLVASARKDALVHLSDVERVPVDGMDKTYWRLRATDGWAAAALLVPGELVAKISSPTPLYVAFPTHDVALIWSSGDPELDHVMLVGAREMYDQMPGQVSPAAHLWTGEEWRRGGEAVRVEQKPESEKSGADGTRTHDL